MGSQWLDKPFSQYVICRIEKDESGEESGTLYNYYLYTHPQGQAIIMREKEDEKEYLYANAGFKNFNANWNNRNNLSYDTYDKLREH